jgi:hypothetical protein
MTTIRSGRRSSFGTSCIQCGNELIAPDASEYRGQYWSDAHVCHQVHLRLRIPGHVSGRQQVNERYHRKGYLPVAVPIFVGRIGEFEGVAWTLTRSLA